MSDRPVRLLSWPSVMCPVCAREVAVCPGTKKLARHGAGKWYCAGSQRTLQALQERRVRGMADVDYDALDAGIRDIVRLAREHGFETTDRKRIGCTGSCRTDGAWKSASKSGATSQSSLPCWNMSLLPPRWRDAAMSERTPMFVSCSVCGLPVRDDDAANPALRPSGVNPRRHMQCPKPMTHPASPARVPLLTDDAMKMLKMLAEPCAEDGDHEWRKCPRCLLIRDVQERVAVTTKYLDAAIVALEQAQRQRLAALPPPVTQIVEAVRTREPEKAHICPFAEEETQCESSVGILLSLAERDALLSALPPAPTPEPGEQS